MTGFSLDWLTLRAGADARARNEDLRQRAAAWTGDGLIADIGGGSGAHAIGAALRWPDLQATVFEIESVVSVTEETIRVLTFGRSGSARTFSRNSIPRSIGS